MPSNSQRTSDTDRTARRSATSPAEACGAAVRYAEQLTGRAPDTVSALEMTEDGWRVEVELVELERIPASTSVLASYEVMVDRNGDLVGYRRLRRYYRNAADGDAR